MKSSPGIGDRIRNRATGSIFTAKQVRTVSVSHRPGQWYLGAPATLDEVLLVADDGYEYGWVKEHDLHTSQWEDERPEPEPTLLSGFWDFTPSKPKCDCGGASVGSTHSHWCSVAVAS